MGSYLNQTLLPSILSLVDSELCDLEVSCDDGNVVRTFATLLAASSPMIAAILLDSPEDDGGGRTLVLPGVSAEQVASLHRRLLLLSAEDEVQESLLGHLGIALPNVMMAGVGLNVEDVELSNEQSWSDNEEVTLKKRRLRRNVSKPKRFDTSDDVKDIAEVLATPRPRKRHLACETCDRTFSSKQALSNHLPLHSGDLRYTCDNCTMRFASAGALYSHRRRHSGTEPRLSCPHCSKTFNSASNVRRHVRARHFEHSDGKVFACATCGKEFKDPSGLASHEKTHLEVKDHKCSQCEKRFRTAAQLRVHQRIHSGERPFACPICPKRFVTCGQVKSHVDHRHLGVKLPKRHLCPECGTAFVKRYDLDVHLLRHSGETPFACTVCARTFRSNRHRKEHERMHTGEKPYACPSCHKSFRAAGGLRQHLRKQESCAVTAATTSSDELASGGVSTDPSSASLLVQTTD